VTEPHSPLLDRLIHLARCLGMRPKPTMTIDPEEAHTIMRWLTERREREE
jgi:hypothetical protein